MQNFASLQMLARLGRHVALATCLVLALADRGESADRASVPEATELKALLRALKTGNTPEKIKAAHDIAKLGPEVLDGSVTASQIAQRLAAFPRRVIADALLDQHVIAGLGNYLRADILFVARVNPLRKMM